MKSILKVKVSHIQALILSLLSAYRLALQNVDFLTLYGLIGYQVENYLLTKGPDGFTYPEATQYCTNLNSDLFAIREDMNVLALFEQMGVGTATVWTGIYASKTAGYLDPVTRYPPTTATRYHTVLTSYLPTNLLGPTTAVGVKIDNGSVFYTMNDRNNFISMKTICMKTLEFPHRVHDVEILTNLKDQMVKEVNQFENMISIEMDSVNRQLALLPTVENTMEPLPILPSINQLEIETKILVLNEIVQEVPDRLGNLTGALDFLLIRNKHENLLTQTVQINRLAGVLVDTPLLLLGSEDAALMDPGTALAVYKTSRIDEYLITFNNIKDSPVAASPLPSISATVPQTTLLDLLSMLDWTDAVDPVSPTTPDTIVTVSEKTGLNTVPTIVYSSSTSPTRPEPEPTSQANYTYLDKAYFRYLLGKEWSAAQYARFLAWSFLPSVWDLVTVSMSFLSLVAHSLAFYFIYKIRKNRPAGVRRIRFSETDTQQTAFLNRSRSLSPHVPRVRVVRTVVTESSVKTGRKQKARAPPPPYYSRDRSHLFDVPLHLRESLLSIN